MQVQIPGYSLVSTLAPGNSSSVFLALDDATGQEVALKIIAPEIIRHIGITAGDAGPHRKNLVHPNIVKVLNTGVWEEHYFIAMEYLSGCSLKHERFEMDLLQRLRAVMDIAYALDYLESRGYVHGAVLPKNIMIRQNDNRAILLGFGIAQLLPPAEISLSIQLPSFIQHLPSAQHVQQRSIVNSDLYNLGLILYWLLTDYLPFVGVTRGDIVPSDANTEIPQLPDYLWAFQAIIDRMLAIDAPMRYPNARVCLADLEALPESALSTAVEGFEKSLHAKRVVSTVDASPAKEPNGEQFKNEKRDSEAFEREGLEREKNPPEALVARRHDAVVPPLEPMSPVPILDRPDISITPTKKLMAVLGYGMSLVLGALVFIFILSASPTVDDPHPTTRLTSSENQPIVANPIKFWPVIVEPTLREQADTLRKRLEEDFSLAVDLIVIYRAMQRSDDHQEQLAAAAGLTELQQKFNRRLREYIGVGDTEAAREEQALAQRLFGEKELLPELRETIWLIEAGQE